MKKLLAIIIFSSAIIAFIAYKMGAFSTEPVDPMAEMIRPPKQILSDKKMMILSSSKSASILPDIRIINDLENKLKDMEYIRRDSLYQMMINSKSKLILRDTNFLNQILYSDTILPMQAEY